MDHRWHRDHHRHRALLRPSTAYQPLETYEGVTNLYRRTLGYRFVEKVLPLDRRVYVLAKATDHSGPLTLVKPTESGQTFLISLKSEEQLTASTQKTADWTFYGMVASLGLGIVLVIADLIS